MAKCKFQKLQEFVSYDSGHSWTALEVYMKGDLIESGSTDCPDCAIMYDWRVVQGDYTCVGTDKYEKLQKYQSLDCGRTWNTTLPFEFQTGSLIQSGSTDCGFVPPPAIYRWVMTTQTRCVETLPQYRTLTTATTCVGYDKYVLAEYQISTDGGQTWTTISTSATTLIEEDSEDCGYVPPMRRTVTTATTCIGTSKYWLTEYQESWDEGETWTTTATTPSSLIETKSYDCGYRTREVTTATTCVGVDKYWMTEYQESSDYGETWTTTGTSATTLIERDSEDCKIDGKFLATYSDERTNSVECNHGTEGVLMSVETQPTGFTASAMTSIIIGECVTEISDYALFNCDSLSSVTIPSSVTTIAQYAFSSCDNLQTVALPNSITTIGEAAFQYDGALTSINIPSGVTRINNGTFKSCRNLASIEVPSGLTYIGNGAFDSCYSLSSITIPSGVTYIGSYAFSGCHNLPSITIPSGITAINDYTFDSCPLTSIEIPNRVTSIGEGAFEYCRQLQTITIPNSVRTIGDSAFAFNDSLESVTIGTGVTYIGDYAFEECPILESVTVLSTTPPTLGEGAFDGYDYNPFLMFYVPSGSVNAYKNASGWSQFSDRIQAITN